MRWVMKTTTQARITTTTVRMAVARFESTPSIPTFANIDVAAANTADRMANINHMRFIIVVRVTFQAAMP